MGLRKATRSQALRRRLRRGLSANHQMLSTTPSVPSAPAAGFAYFLLLRPPESDPSLTLETLQARVPGHPSTVLRIEGLNHQLNPHPRA